MTFSTRRARAERAARRAPRRAGGAWARSGLRSRRAAARELPAPGERVEGVVVGKADTAEDAQHERAGRDRQRGAEREAPRGVARSRAAGRHERARIPGRARRRASWAPRPARATRGPRARLRRRCRSQRASPPAQLAAVAVSQAPPAHVRRGGRPGAGRAHAAQRGASGQVHHAYLFVGPRGTGKTSMAKILAACLNCERGPTIEPCGQCDSCRVDRARELAGRDRDGRGVNNSVDEIRDLRESVAYAPVSGGARCTSSTRPTCSRPPPGTRF